jgi:hypothetical protein
VARLFVAVQCRFYEQGVECRKDCHPPRCPLAKKARRAAGLFSRINDVALAGASESIPHDAREHRLKFTLLAAHQLMAPRTTSIRSLMSIYGPKKSPAAWPGS